MGVGLPILLSLEKKGDGGVRGSSPVPHLALEMVPQLTEQCPASPPLAPKQSLRPLCKHHTRERGRVVGECWNIRPLLLFHVS